MSRLATCVQIFQPLGFSFRMLPLSGLHVPDGVGSQHHYHHLCHHKIVYHIHHMIFTTRPDNRNPHFRDHLYPLPLLALQRARGQLGIFDAGTGLSCNQKINLKSGIMIWWICEKWSHPVPS